MQTNTFNNAEIDEDNDDHMTQHVSEEECDEK